MSYTKEFEDWSRMVGKLAEIRSAHNSEHAHFWLSAFVRLVKEEAASSYTEASSPWKVDYELGQAFNAICQRFGLEEAASRKRKESK